jgi:AcrR family transcriptional regulator
MQGVALSPRITAADQRLTDLLDSVRGVFAVKGFDGASMQDLAQAAGMSAGNFYRYFPSKDAIIQAMVERDLAGIENDFAAIINSPDPRAMLMRALDQNMDSHDCEEGAIWAEIRAASSRRSELGQVMARMETIIIGYLTVVLGRIAGVEPAEAATRYHAHATLLFTLVQGLMMRRRPGDGFETSPLRGLTHVMVEALLAEIATGPARAGAAEIKENQVVS